MSPSSLCGLASFKRIFACRWCARLYATHVYQWSYSSGVMASQSRVLLKLASPYTLYTWSAVDISAVHLYISFPYTNTHTFGTGQMGKWPISLSAHPSPAPPSAHLYPYFGWRLKPWNLSCDSLDFKRIPVPRYCITPSYHRIRPPDLLCQAYLFAEGQKEVYSGGWRYHV